MIMWVQYNALFNYKIKLYKIILSPRFYWCRLYVILPRSLNFVYISEIMYGIHAVQVSINTKSILNFLKVDTFVAFKKVKSSKVVKIKITKL